MVVARQLAKVREMVVQVRETKSQRESAQSSYSTWLMLPIIGEHLQMWLCSSWRLPLTIGRKGDAQAPSAVEGETINDGQEDNANVVNSGMVHSVHAYSFEDASMQSPF